MSGLTVLWGSAEAFGGMLNQVALMQAPPPAGSPGSSVLTMGLLIVPMLIIMYFFVWRPENKQMEAHRSMVAALKKGDEVLLLNGIFGRVHEVTDKALVIEIARDVRIRVIPGAISRVLKPEASEGAGADAGKTSDKSPAKPEDKK